jgi:hypothetical protein
MGDPGGPTTVRALDVRLHGGVHRVCGVGNVRLRVRVAEFASGRAHPLCLITVSARAKEVIKEDRAPRRQQRPEQQPAS